jgi:aldehyde dehydrogenase (NAD+)
MEKEEIGIILENQRKFFATGKTINIRYRLENLRKLKSLILQYEEEIKEALWKDFRKPGLEVAGTETRFVIKELNLAIRKLKRWAGPHRVRTPILHFIAHSYIAPQPYGQVLVLSPWNFPFQLALLPALSAIAAGNCVILKISQQVPNIRIVMEKIFSNFPGELITVMNGDHSISEYLLNYKFDYIFFTGRCKTGKYIMEKAAVNLTPLSLELGGKNPCVVAADAKLDFAAKRIAWGKFLNAGQTCICPDYLLIDRKIKDRFLEIIATEISNFYNNDPENSNDFARIINPASVNRLAAFIKDGNIVTGGKYDPENRYVAPTIIKDINPEDPIMQEEIFGPVLPVIDYENIEEVYGIIEQHPKPLAAYIFTKNRKLSGEFLKRVRSGTAAINDVVMQIASPYLPYGGIGCSGLGRYHGKKSFETFSNMRSVLVKSNLIDMFLRYPPYNKLKENVIKWIMR